MECNTYEVLLRKGPRSCDWLCISFSSGISFKCLGNINEKWSVSWPSFGQLPTATCLSMMGRSVSFMCSPTGEMMSVLLSSPSFQASVSGSKVSSLSKVLYSNS